MAKTTLIKWRKEDEKNLRRAISDFNKKVRKLNKERKNASYLPEEIDYAGTKDLITTRAELDRVIKSLGRFKGREAFKKVELQSGDTITAWEKKEISYQQRQAKRRITKRMAEIKRLKPEYFTGKQLGDVEYRKLEATLKAIENFGKKKPSGKLSKAKRKERFNEAKARIENWGSSDFEMRQAIVYRENYFEMFTKTYSLIDGFDLVFNKLKQISNPLEFYRVLSKLDNGEQLKDISFMYEAQPYQRNLKKLAEGLGVNLDDVENKDDEDEDEDSDEDEGE